MTNLSYCRFQNTLTDLQDCFDHLDEQGLEDLSPDEMKAAEKLIALCEDISFEFYEGRQQQE